MKKGIIFGGILMLCLGVFALNPIYNNEANSLLYQNIEALAQVDTDSSGDDQYLLPVGRIPCRELQDANCYAFVNFGGLYTEFVKFPGYQNCLCN